MKDTEIERLAEYVYSDGAYYPVNDIAKEDIAERDEGEIVYFKEVKARDIVYFKSYMALLNCIYDLLPEKFHKVTEKRMFYKWLKHLKKFYKVQYSFLDHERVASIKCFLIEKEVFSEKLIDEIALKFGRTEMIEYDSIAFGRMNENKFHDYVKEQLPYIYENVIGVFYEGEDYIRIIEMIEEEFKKFLSKK